MENKLSIKMYSFTMDCKDPHALAKFYAALLNWEIAFYNEEWAWALRERDRGNTPGSRFSAIPHTSRRCGRKSRKRSSRWHIWTSQSMIWNKRSSLQLTVGRRWQKSSSPTGGGCCSTQPDTLFACAR